MREQVSSAAEFIEINSPSDISPLMPGIAHKHLIGRLAAYKSANRHFVLHNCLKGVKSRNLGPHIFLEESSGSRCTRRPLIYQVWHAESLQRPNGADSIAEHWHYRRIFASDGKRSMRIEVWYDSRPWSLRNRLKSASEVLLDRLA